MPFAKRLAGFKAIEVRTMRRLALATWTWKMKGREGDLRALIDNRNCTPARCVLNSEEAAAVFGDAGGIYPGGTIGCTRHPASTVSISLSSMVPELRF
jgi:hypothetical protein